MNNENFKKCIKCGENKSTSEFYKHKMMFDGLLNKCKDCCKQEAKERVDILKLNPEWIEKERERGREKYHRLEYKDKNKPTLEQKKATIERYKAKFPEKIEASHKTARLKPIIKGNELHHWSYNKEHQKDVIELSVKDHNIVHRHTIYDQERKMYRTKEGVLLDTKENAISYYRSELGICN